MDNQFNSWLNSMGWTKSEAARQLGVSRQTVVNYCNGNSPVPPVVTLACEALQLGIRMSLTLKGGSK